MGVTTSDQTNLHTDSLPNALNTNRSVGTVNCVVNIPNRKLNLGETCAREDARSRLLKHRTRICNFSPLLVFRPQSAAVRRVSCGLNGQPPHSGAHLRHGHQESVARACHSGPAQSPRTQTVRTAPGELQRLFILCSWLFFQRYILTAEFYQVQQKKMNFCFSVAEYKPYSLPLTQQL